MRITNRSIVSRSFAVLAILLLTWSLVFAHASSDVGDEKNMTVTPNPTPSNITRPPTDEEMDKAFDEKIQSMQDQILSTIQEGLKSNQDQQHVTRDTVYDYNIDIAYGELQEGPGAIANRTYLEDDENDDHAMLKAEPTETSSYQNIIKCKVDEPVSGNVTVIGHRDENAETGWVNCVQVWWSEFGWDWTWAGWAQLGTTSDNELYLSNPGYIDGVAKYIRVLVWGYDDGNPSNTQKSWIYVDCVSFEDQVPSTYMYFDVLSWEGITIMTYYVDVDEDRYYWVESLYVRVSDGDHEVYAYPSADMGLYNFYRFEYYSTYDYDNPVTISCDADFNGVIRYYP